MAGQLKTLAGPAYLSNAAADIYTPAASTIYAVIYHIKLVNVAAATPTASLYIGATGGSAGGTEILKSWAFATAGAAGSEKDIYFPKGRKMLSTDFLSGLASSLSQVVIMVMGEQIVV